MEESRINDIMNERFKKRIIKKSIIIFICLICIIISFYIFLTKRKTEGIKYYENGKVDYNISLNKNEFFDEEVLPANNQYIASLIDTININFKYNLQMKDNYDQYKYKYRIEAQTKIIEKTTQNDIYKFNDILKDEEEVNPNSSKFAINNNITVDYKKYNSIIKNMVSTYDLSNVDCKTIVTLYIDLVDNDGVVRSTSKMGINIPLNVKTANIEVENNIDNTEERTFVSGKYIKSSWIFIIIAIILIIYEANNITKLVKDVKKNCPQEIIDDIRLKRILREYGPYIQRVKSGFDIGRYDMIRISKFEDLLRIREIIQNPILMIENETNTKTYFVVTTMTSTLYSYEINHGNVKEISN